MDDLTNFVNRTRNNYYYTLEDSDMLSTIYSNKNSSTGDIIPLKMYLFTANAQILDNYNINKTSLGPFDMDTEDLKEKLFDVQEMSINFHVHQYLNPYAGAEGTCFLSSIM